jgi:tetratricopeptide (TPR) repeat protein
MYYLGALVLLGLGVLFIGITSPKTTAGGAQYERRMQLRTLGQILLIAAGLTLVMAGLTQFYANDAPGTHSSPTARSPGQDGAVPVPLLLRQAFQLMGQGQFDVAMDKVNAALRAEPQNPAAYELRGNIDVEKKAWDQAEKDYLTALAFNGKSVSVKFNLAEIDFMQKNYDAARSGFVILEHDPDMGDLATYKVFLCDLFGGHEDVAAKEFDAFNQVGSNASYYFANAAWSLYHQKTEDARGWLTSAARIYPPAKFRVYSASLMELGYPGRLNEPASVP